MDGMPGFSIPATEHSVTTSWGRENELEFFRNILKVHGQTVNPLGGRSLVSVVIDTYDQDEAIRKWLTPASEGGLLDDLKASNMCVVLRPDSGDPIINVVHCLELIGARRRRIQRQGLRGPARLCADDPRRRHQRGHAAAHPPALPLSPLVDRQPRVRLGRRPARPRCRARHPPLRHEDLRGLIGGEVRDVQKLVATDPTKASKAGRFAVVRPKMSAKLQTIAESDLDTGEHNYLQTVFEDGELVNPVTFEQVREVARANRR
jgi:nicotinamide phosphoribosyltransferase